MRWTVRNANNALILLQNIGLGQCVRTVSRSSLAQAESILLVLNLRVLSYLSMSSTPRLLKHNGPVQPGSYIVYVCVASTQSITLTSITV